MFRQRDFVTAVLVIYLVLIILFFAYKEPNFYNNSCIYGSACVRFCCDDRETCTNKFISANFSTSLIPLEDDSENDVKHLFGRPDCTILKPLEAKRQWQFTYDGSVEKRDNTTGQYFYFDVDEYCLEARNGADNGSIEWDVMYCETQRNFNTTVHVILISASVVVLVAAILVYFFSRSLQTDAGRCELMLLIGIFMVHVSYIWIHHYQGPVGMTLAIILVTGFLLTYFWTCVLTFDIWWSFRYQESTQEDVRKFRMYCYFVFGTIAAFVIMAMLKDMSEGSFRYFMRDALRALLVCFLIMAVVDVILLLQTGYMVFQLSKTTRSTDHSWFQKEKLRFCKYLGIYFVLLITWPIEIYSMHMYNSIASKNISDIIKLYSVIVIFVVFAWQKSLTIFRRYDTLNNSLL